MNQTRKIDFVLHCILVFLLVLLLIIKLPTAGIFILIAQFFVGCYQVLTSFFRTLDYHSFDRKIQRYLRFYWIACGLYGLGWLVIVLLKPHTSVFMIYLFSAWGIAFYYCYITYLLAFPSYIKSHLDI